MKQLDVNPIQYEVHQREPSGDVTIYPFDCRKQAIKFLATLEIVDYHVYVVKRTAVNPHHVSRDIEAFKQRVSNERS